MIEYESIDLIPGPLILIMFTCIQARNKWGLFQGGRKGCEQYDILIFDI